MSGIALRPMSVGEILDRTFQIYRRSFATMFVVALLGAAPGLVYSLGSSEGATSMAAVGLRVLIVPIMAFAGLLAWGALAELYDRSVRGLPVTAGAGLARGLRTMPALLGANLLAASVLILVLAVVIPMLAAARGGNEGGNTGAGVIVALLLLALFAVGLVLWVAMSYLTAPAVVVEQKGPGAAVARSWRLGKGARLRIFGIAVLSLLIVILPAFAIGVIVGMVTGLKGTMGPMAGTLLAVGQVVGSALTTPYTIGCMMLTYYDRRVRLEGLDVELASAELAPAP